MSVPTEFMCPESWQDRTGKWHRCRDVEAHRGDHVCPCGVALHPSPSWLRENVDGFGMLGHGLDDE